MEDLEKLLERARLAPLSEADYTQLKAVLAHVCGFSSPRVRKYLKTQERVVIFGILW
jgi:hypothetical protein